MVECVQYEINRSCGRIFFTLSDKNRKIASNTKSMRNFGKNTSKMWSTEDIHFLLDVISLNSCLTSLRRTPVRYKYGYGGTP